MSKRSPKEGREKKSKIFSKNLENKTFTLRGINFKQANMVRLFLLSGIEVTAIDHIYILENSSLLTNEQLKFRLTETPIYYPPNLDLPEERAVLKVSGGTTRTPNTNEYMEAPLEKKVSFITSDLIALPDNFEARSSLIAILTKGQSLNLEISFARGKATGEDSVRFSCIETISFDLNTDLPHDQLNIQLRDKDIFTFSVVQTMDAYFPYICDKVEEFIKANNFSSA